jgi:hypothetical protein
VGQTKIPVCSKCGQEGIELVILGVGVDQDVAGEFRLVCAEWDGTRHDIACSEVEAKHAMKCLSEIGPGLTMICQDAETLPNTAHIPEQVVKEALQAFLYYRRTGNLPEGFGVAGRMTSLDS